MVENTFLTARQMAQDLVRNKVEPGDVIELQGYLRKQQKEGGVESLFAHLQENGETSPNPLAEACEAHLRPFENDPNAMLDILGWGIGFMRYYRGEGDRPQPSRRPSQARRRRPPRQSRKPREVTVSMNSLQPGQALQGTVRRIMPYGAFVSVGAERDGLVHISEMAEGFTGDPAEAVNLNDTIEVWVKSVDLKKQRISLTMKGAEAAMATEAKKTPNRQSKPSRPRRGTRRRSAPAHSGDAKLFQDDTPKEMTALGEALRSALEAQQGGDEDKASRHKKKKERASRELAEAQRRTLYG